MELRTLPQDSTGLRFRNTIVEDDSANYFSYTYMYNGGGVAAGDLDGDSLPDLVLVSNRSGGALYRNLGGLRFADVSKAAGFDLGATWATGVTLADVNADGHLDIYVCASGPVARPAGTRRNLLFINDGKGHFTERAQEHGLDRIGHSTMAYFVDLDGDVDLDCFIVGHRNDFHTIRQVITDPRFVPVPDQSDKLYLNDGHGHFTDRTVESGVASRRFGLAAAIGDVNGDGRPDIHVSNDFYSQDQLLIHQGNDPRTGVPLFRDEALARLGHTSYYSMGADLADYNNDGLRDLYVLDMTPSDHRLNKENMASMAPGQFRRMVENGFHHQYMVNTLQLNNGDGHFSEVGQLAGVDRTDWSWTPLFCDLDNDGWKDLFVTNGILRDVTNSDFRETVKRIATEQGTDQDFRPILDLAPTHQAEKMVFRNKGDLTFEKAMDAWNYHQLTHSNGATYADLDRDGDLDLVTVDVNAPATVVRNMASERGVGHHLQLVLRGDDRDPSATGASATLHAQGAVQLADLLPARGFQGSVEPLLHFGLGDAAPDSLVITWPDGLCTSIASPGRDRRMAIDRRSSAVHPPYRATNTAPLFQELTDANGIRWTHQENSFDDLATETLLPQAQSQHGPCLAVADVNGDGTEDVFIGASRGERCALFLQDHHGRFSRTGAQGWDALTGAEFIGAHLFDADGDRDLDLYLAAGSTEMPEGDASYQDHLFTNDGHGRFTDAPDALPALRTSTQCVASEDLDGDGDLDLFVGGRNVPGAWPAPPPSHVLINGHGRFTDASATWLKGHERPGLITGAAFADLDGDRRNELVLCGEWMPLTVWKVDREAFTDISTNVVDTALTGWWQGLAVADLDGDGDNDVIAGNLGLNNKFHASKEKPLKVYMSDLDRNGTNDIVLAKCGATGELPVRGRECSSGQMPFIKDKFPTYKAFAGASLDAIYGRDQLLSSVRYKATTFASTVFLNQGGKLEAAALPLPAQVAPIRSFVVRDVDSDGHPDIVAVGNLYGAEVETTRYDAGLGLVLKGDGKGSFTTLDAARSGIRIAQDMRHVAPLKVAGQDGLVVVSNSGPVQLYVQGSLAGNGPAGGQDGVASRR